MNTAKSQALNYFCIGAGLINFYLLAFGWSRLALLILAIGFFLVALLFAISLKFRSQWLVKVTEQVGDVSVGHISILLVFLSLATGLVQTRHIIPSLVFLYIGTLSFALAVGNQLGTASGSFLLNKRKQRKHSYVITTTQNSP